MNPVQSSLDPETLERLAAAYREFAEPLVRHCMYRRMSQEDAQEVVQDAFVQTYEYLVRGNEVQNLKVFLYRVANNLIIDQVRKKKISREVSLEELQERGVDLWEDAETPHVHHQIDARNVVDALATLEPRDYELFVLRYVEGMMPAEIANKTGISANTISVRLHRIVKQVSSMARVERRRIGRSAA